MKIRPGLLLTLLVIIVAVNVNAINLNNANCDQIVQCDAYAPGFVGGSLVCNNAVQNSPDTEEVMVTTIRLSDVCESGDDVSDCFEWGADFYEELSSSDIYQGNGANRSGGVTSCCSFGDLTVFTVGIVNDFNSDRNNPITRKWNVRDITNNIKDYCPTTTYNPQDITQTTDLSTFNISFKPFNNNYDQWVEGNFVGSAIRSVQDYYLQNASDSYAYQDEIKEWVQSETIQYDFDIYDIFGYTESEYSVRNIFENNIEYIKDSCTVNTMIGCTDAGSTSFSCTANTGVNIKSDLQAFLNAFFNKYKTPLIMQLGHEWCYGSTLSDCDTGFGYWETALGIDSSGSILTYQGMRQFTTRTLSRIQSDWVINDYDAVFVTCNNDADIRVVMSEENVLGTSTYEIDPNLNKYDLIKGETYHWGAFNDETDVVTTDSLFRYDWNNDGTWDIDWDDQEETEGFLTSSIDTSVATFDLNLDAETWGKGGTNSVLTPYRIYENPAIIFDRDEGLNAELGSSVTFTPFDNTFYDIGDIDWFCYDITNDGTYDYVFRKTSSTSYNCTTDGGTSINTDSNLYNNFIAISSFEIGDTPGTYTMRLKGGQNLVNRANYTTFEDIDYTFNVPSVNADITLKSSSWNTYAGDTINFNLENSIVSTDIEAVCYDEDFTNSTYDYCLSKDGTGYCGLSSCILDSTPENNIFNIDFIDVGDYVNHQIRARVIETYSYFDEDTQIYSFRLPVISPAINWLSDNFDVRLIENITFNTVGSTSENPIFSICMDIDNDGSDEQCETSTSTTFTIEYTDVNDFNIHDVAITIIDDEGYSDEFIDTFSFRDTYNTAGIRRVSGSVTIGDYINETGWLVYDAGLSNTEDAHYVCYDYTNNGTYDKCYSNIASESHCGLSCEYNPFVLDANLNLSYSIINDFGDFTLKLLVDNDNTISNATYNYGIFLDSPGKWYLPKIISTDNDDDINDDFRINEIDQNNLNEDIPDNKVWNFEFTSLYSTYLYEPDFSCWGNSIIGEYEVCYSLDEGYNKFCDLNCTSSKPWYYPYTINSNISGLENNVGYSVNLILGSIDRDVASFTFKEIIFNPPNQEKIDEMRGFIIVSITIFIILVFIVGFLLIGLILFPTVILSLILRKRKNKNKKNDENQE